MDLEGKIRERRVSVVGLDMSRDKPVARRILWGVFVMGIGVALLLAQLGVLQTPWKFWPAVYWVIALGHLLERKPGGAATWALMGVAFFAAQFGWFGLSYRTFWPILVVAVGVGIVIGALSGEDRGGARAEADHGTR